MKKSKLLHDENGFTLVELLIYTAISSIILVASMVGLTSANRSYHSSNTAIQEVRESRDSLEAVSEELKYASNIKIAAAKTQITSYLYATDPTTRSIYLGSDKILYKKIGSNPAIALLKVPLQNFTCSFNSSDTSNRTIDLKVTFPSNTQIATTVHALNASDSNGYIP